MADSRDERDGPVEDFPDSPNSVAGANSSDENKPTSENRQPAYDQVGAEQEGPLRPAKEKIEAVLGETRETGADRLAVLGSALEAVVPRLEKDMPGLAACFRNAATWINDSANDVREQRFEVLLQSANNYAQKNPVAAFGLSAMSGFVISRFLKSGTKSIPNKKAG
jgi:hypothetical protein